MKTLEKFKIPIGELFEVLGLSGSPYDTFAPSPVSLMIDGPNGFIPVLGLVRKHHEVARYMIEDVGTIECSTKHIVFENGVPSVIGNCVSIDTVNGPARVLGVELLGPADVFDVSLPLPHQYITPNGIIHHNTSLAKVLINEVGVDPFDVLEINASRENSADVIRDKIVNFVSTMPFGKFKVVLLDESDYLSSTAQAILRGVTETYASTARFIFTANYPNRIIPALHSRCQGFHIEKLDHTEFTARVATVLVSENVEFELDTLDTYVKATYPDLRKCLNTCQMNSNTGTLLPPSDDVGGSSDHVLEAVKLFKAGKIREARQVLCANTRSDDVESIFRWAYDNLDLWGDTPEEQDKAIIIIRQGLVNHSFVSDAEINLSASLVELTGIRA